MGKTLKEATPEFLAARHTLMAFIGGLVRNHHDTEELFQETWVRLAEAIENGTEIRDTAKWCRGVARNLVLHYCRERQNPLVVVSDELVERVDLAFAEHDEPGDGWEERRAAQEACVEVLPVRARDMLSMKYEEELSFQTIAERLGKSTSSCMMALSRIRRILAECVEGKLAEARGR